MMISDSGIAVQAETLLARMNLRQKVGQMVQTERMAITPAEVKKFHIGSVLSGGGSCPGDNRPSDWIQMNDDYWQASMEQDEEHLAIPVIYGVDAVHGHSNVLGATIFPHNIGLGATRDPELLERIASATAREILATGVDWTFAPTLAVCRNILWGRSYESYSQDAELVASYAAGFVRGLQTDLGDDSVVACVKHWVGDGGTRHGVDQGETRVSEATLEHDHMRPYYPALAEGVLTVMASFNSWNGDKCHGHSYLLTEVLKQRLGFNGFVISDWDGIDYLDDDYAETVALGVNAGIDMLMVSEAWRECIGHLLDHVKQGRVSMARIDDAVRRILSVKLAFGLFDKPNPSARKWSDHSSFGGPEHREIAREAVRKSLVLLKNERGLLPLSKAMKVLVAGKNAHNRGHQCGGFTVDWQGVSGNDRIVGGTSIWEGIKAMAPNAQMSQSSGGEDADPRLHDLAVVVVGETPYAEGMGDIRDGDNVVVESGSMIRGSLKVLEPYGHTPVLADLHPEDIHTIETIVSKGVPVVVVLLSGRPLIINRELAVSDALFAAWLPGSEGQGIADVLFGDHDFQGRLSFNWPASGEPIFNPDADQSENILFSQGYGLSYG